MLADRSSNMHDAAIFIFRIGLTRTRAVLASKRKVDIIPSRVILTHGSTGTVVYHDAFTISEINPMRR